jgi:hypothetical protein
MNGLLIVLSSLSGLMMLFTVICGAWLRSKGADPEGIAFHLKLAVFTVVITLATLGLLLARVMRG